MPDRTDNQKALAKMVAPLLSWYDDNRRILPWRENPTPYRVWVSEIMLQQTRVEAVKPYFARFMAAFPDIDSLSKAPQERLLKLWEGLGYYSRARNLQKTAKLCAKQYNGQLPGSYEELLALPGIGEYTAGAVASIAFGEPVPAVDGNVLRVAARVLASQADIASPQTKKSLRADLEAVMPSKRPGDFNQSLMELGATVCLPGGAPRCGSCPILPLCKGAALGLQGQLPVKAPKKERTFEEHTVMVLVSGGKAALQKRPDKGLLAGLWEFPYTNGFLEADGVRSFVKERGMNPLGVTRMGDFIHVFTHREWHMRGFLVQTDVCAEGYWWAGREALLTKAAIPSAYQKYVSELLLYGGLF